MAANEIDTGSFPRAELTAAPAHLGQPRCRRLRLNVKASFGAAPGFTNAAAPAEMLGVAPVAAPPPPAGSVINRALTVLHAERTRAAGFAAARPTDGTEFVPDPVSQRTSSAAPVVHFQQFYRGVPIFLTGHTVRFAPDGQQADVLGDDVVLAAEVDTAPTLVAT